MINIVVIEDEIEASRYLENILKEYEGIDEIKILNSIEEASEWFSRDNKPDIIFMDVQLGDGLSFDLFNKYNINCSVVFITAYDDFALKAIKHSSLDYLLKPVNSYDIGKVLVKFYSNKLKQTQNIREADFFNRLGNFKERFLVKEGNQYLPVKIEEIAYVYWSDYAFIKKFDGKSFLINYSINQVEDILPPHLFIRINRQILTNINAIESLLKEGSSHYINLLPKFSESIKISKDSYTSFKRRFS